MTSAGERRTDVTVRPVRRADADQWAAMRAALWPDQSVGEHAEEIAELFAGKAAEPEAVLVAALADGVTLVGFAELSRRAYAEGCVTSPVAYLEGWYVAPEWRRRGVGGALVAASEAWARAQGLRELASDTELENRVSAEAHAALGFEDVGVIRCFRKTLQ